MRWVKRMGAMILFVPLLLITFFVIFEIFGMCVNHIATKRQTDQLRMNLENEIPDIQIVSIYSKTGNTSGTGNHVDCLSSVTFSTEMRESEVENRLSKCYELDEWGCVLERTDDGYYVLCLNTSAPFADNIEGH